MKRALFSLALLFPAAAAAADIRAAAYDPWTEELVVAIAYRGTEPDHKYVLEPGKCEPGGEAIARLIDKQGMEPARKGFRVQARFDLAKLGCRPSRVTLRLGRTSHATVKIPPPR